MSAPASERRVAPGRAGSGGGGKGDTPRAEIKPRYIWTMLGSLAGSFLLFYLFLFGLSATDNLPPPSFANSICVDEKLAFHRENPDSRPNLLVIGSSVAWRHFDGDVVAQETPAAIPLNGGFCGLTANQSAYAANWLLQHYSGVREVLLIASPEDFKACTKFRTEVFDARDADAYVFGKASPWPYYMKYFSPGSLLRNAMTVAKQRSGENAVDPLVFDRYGSGPVRMTGDRDTLLYGAVERLDQTCFEALGQMAAKMKQEGRRLMVASTPMHPEWRALYDADGAVLRQFSTRIRQAIEPFGGEYWDAASAGLIGEEGFYDGIHLRWSAVAPFSAALAQQFQFGRAPVSVAAQNSDRKL